MYRRVVFILFFALLMVSCSFFKGSAPEDAVARVNDHYLYKSDIRNLLESASDHSSRDSAYIVTSYINEWATEQLLLDGAMRNVSEDDQKEYDALVKKYKRDLYTKAYKDALILKGLDSIVSDEEASNFYEKNKVNFALNEDLVQLRYIQVNEDYRDLETVKEHFIAFKQDDMEALDSLKLKFNTYFLNDSTWIQRSVVQAKIHPINSNNADQLLKKTNFLQLRDSLGLYLIAVRNTLSRKQTAPLEYVRPTIDQIIRNKRKLDLIKELEKDIKEDAIKDKRFEIYK